VCVSLSVSRNQHNNKEPNKTKTWKPDQNSKEDLRKKAREQANTLDSFRTDSKTTPNASNLWGKQIFEDRNTTVCVCVSLSLSLYCFFPPPPLDSRSRRVTLATNPWLLSDFTRVTVRWPWPTNTGGCGLSLSLSLDCCRIK
jgi:hypothetical protein